MTLEMELERMRRYGELIGEKRGVEKRKLDVARELLRDGIPVKKITRYTGLSPEALKEALEGSQTRSGVSHE